MAYFSLNKVRQKDSARNFVADKSTGETKKEEKK
jgi:hypothetical protein